MGRHLPVAHTQDWKNVKYFAGDSGQRLSVTLVSCGESQ